MTDVIATTASYNAAATASAAAANALSAAPTPTISKRRFDDGSTVTLESATSSFVDLLGAAVSNASGLANLGGSRDLMIVGVGLGIATSSATNSTVAAPAANGAIAASPAASSQHDMGTSTPTTMRSAGAQTDDSASSTPRSKYEAFVMTGDKILNLNPKISPSYAQVRF